ncbi:MULTISPECIES: hypothetical protein [unclassified Streptomyces]|uniref:hypothetical protein n=1 Tax=unclassified Streptomyces TaxID=2593676 RepID=UPI0015E16CAA|nr:MULTISPECIES: hypothetical protein [unclassified Streptomyces]
MSTVLSARQLRHRSRLVTGEVADLLHQNLSIGFDKGLGFEHGLTLPGVGFGAWWTR